MITERLLKEVHAGTILATGLLIDSPDDININSSELPLRWVAIAGGAHDWAVYVGPVHWHVPDIARQGDKILAVNAARILVCSPEALARYRQ